MNLQTNLAVHILDRQTAELRFPAICPRGSVLLLPPVSSPLPRTIPTIPCNGTLPGRSVLFFRRPPHNNLIPKQTTSPYTITDILFTTLGHAVY